MYRLNCCVVVAVAGLGGQAVAGIINVPGDQPTIQAGVDAAMDGDEVVVAPGTYFENVVVGNQIVTLRSSGGPTVTTIDGTVNQVSEQALRITGGTVNIDGFTMIRSANDRSTIFSISGGVSLTTNCRFFSNGQTEGASITGAASTISDCTFEGLRSAVDVRSGSRPTELQVME